MTEAEEESLVERYLDTPACSGHRTTGYHIDFLNDGTELPWCADCGRPSRIPQRFLRLSVG